MSRPHDPIATAIVWRIRRAVWYGLLGGGATLALWFWWMSAGFDITGMRALDTFIAGLRGQEQRYLCMAAWGCLALGFCLVTVAYMGIALWWRGQGDIESRGTRWGGRE
jgi:hypothetical protein